MFDTVGDTLNFWNDFRSTSGSQYPFLVETSDFTGTCMWLVVGQLRPIYPHIRRAFLTKSHLFVFCFVIEFRSSSTRVPNSKVPKAQHFSESSLRACIDPPCIPVVQSIFFHQLYMYICLNQPVTLLLSSTDQGTNRQIMSRL